MKKSQPPKAKQPRYLRIYDNNGETWDRYTVVFTRYCLTVERPVKYGKIKLREYMYVGMSGNPYSPMGFYQHGFSKERIDYPSYAHLGRKITFSDLPKDCQLAVMAEYLEIWKHCAGAFI